MENKKKNGSNRAVMRSVSDDSVTSAYGLTTKENDNSRIMLLTTELFGLPDIDLNNPDEVRQRLKDFFMLYAKYDLKPTLTGLSSALNGHRRQWLWGVVQGRPTGGGSRPISLPEEVVDLLKRAYVLLENQWEIYMLSDMIKPAAGIFLGKNNFGYRDQVEYSIAPELPQEKDFSVEEIRKRYLFDDEE